MVIFLKRFTEEMADWLLNGGKFSTLLFFCAVYDDLLKIGGPKVDMMGKLEKFYFLVKLNLPGET